MGQDLDSKQYLSIRLWALAVGLTVFTRFGYWHYSGQMMQGYEWDLLASHLLEGKGYLYPWEWVGSSMIAFGFPGMPAILYLLYQIPFPKPMVFLWFQFALAAACCILVGLHAQHISNQKWICLGSCLLFAIEPGLVLYGSIKIHDTSTIILILLLGYVCFPKANDCRISWKTSIVWGILFGIGAYVRSTLLLFFPACLLAIMMFRNPFRIQNFIKITIAFFIAIVLLSPWVIRNFNKLGTPLIHSADTFNFWRGNNPFATGGALDAKGNTILQRAGLYDETLRMDEMERRTFFSEKARQWIQDNPRGFIWITIKKAFYFWWFAPQMGQQYASNAFELYKRIYALALSLLFIGLWNRFQNHKLKAYDLSILFFCMAISGVQSFFYVEGRHRLILYPILFPYIIWGAWVLIGTKTKSAIYPSTNLSMHQPGDGHLA